MRRTAKNTLKVIFQITFIAAIFIAAFYADAKTLRVAVLDTGINMYLQSRLPVCEVHDVSGYGILDTHGHGSHIAATIAKYAGDTKYCLVIIKFFDKSMSKEQTAGNSIKGLKWVLNNKIDILNYSGGGVYPMKEEREVITKLLDSGVIINAAAGNEATELNDKDGYYPASYDKRINVVGALDKEGVKLDSSNWGTPVTFWRLGQITVETSIETDSYMQGTSQATAVFTGEMIHDKGKEITISRGNQTRLGKTVRRAN